MRFVVGIFKQARSLDKSRTVLTQHSRSLNITRSLRNTPNQVSESQFSKKALYVSGLAGVGIAAVLLYSNNADEKTESSPMESSPLIEDRIQSLEAEVSKLMIFGKNRAFVFIKPHAVTPEVEKLVLAKFEEKNIKVVSTGEISGKQIDEELLVDTHYGAIASKAVTLSPAALSLTDKAKKDFLKLSGGLSWEEALGQGKVKNAKEYCELKQIDGQTLDTTWSTLKRGVNLTKFGGGFYCGKLSDDDYVINGFYMAMRDKFTGVDDKIKYFVVEFDPSQLKWSSFRNDVLGPTDPAGAPKGSLRRSIFDDWKKLGLKTKPDTGDNGVHASASPFEAFAERCNWLKNDYRLETDEFGVALLRNGVLQPSVVEYFEDPTVEYEGKKESFFDLLEDLNTEECFRKILDITGL